jgi:CDP-paratose 2-epimerase
MTAATPRSGEKVVITGGAGFIGSNLADRLSRDGAQVLVLDNVSRAGVERNLAWLERRHGSRVQHVQADVRSASAVARAIDGADRVFHLAAQVAVTTSLVDPRRDFEVNALGTLNVLEAVRAQHAPPALVFTSTNKVYGALGDVALRDTGTRWQPADDGVRARGIGETRPLDFHSPYGCSKGAADQYIVDFGRTYGIPSVVFRMSCIYGPRQLGTEDQGWVAHFLMRGLAGAPITIYGDGKQVRDILFVDDLVEALLLASRGSDRLGGRAFNMGGGPTATLSLIELVARMAELDGVRPTLAFGAERVGDQRYYVSDFRSFAEETGWRPRVGVDEGLERLHGWLRAQRSELLASEAAQEAVL